MVQAGGAAALECGPPLAVEQRVPPYAITELDFGVAVLCADPSCIQVLCLQSNQLARSGES